MTIDLKRVQFFVTEAQYERIAKHAERAGLSMDQYCRSNTFAKMEHYPLKEEKEILLNIDTKTI